MQSYLMTPVLSKFVIQLQYIVLLSDCLTDFSELWSFIMFLFH